MYTFDAKETKNKIVEWIKMFFEQNGKDCIATVGLSGGKDSSIVTALCVEALGKNRVLGVLMPDGEQTDMQYINDYTNRIKEEDHILYAIYGTPAESLCGLQVEQFRKIYGIIENVSDKEYVSNSFHCHVSEDMNPIEKQDKEGRFWNLFNGGKIQYCRYNLGYNKQAIKTLVLRAMDKGFYEGVNLAMCYCEDCGYQQVEMQKMKQYKSEPIKKLMRKKMLKGKEFIHSEEQWDDFLKYLSKEVSICLT